MSYTPTNWTNGDVITTEKLNKIENGIVAASSSGGVLVVHESVEGTTHTLDKTWQEIHDSDFAVLRYPDGGIQWTTGAVEDEGDYLVGFWVFGNVEPTIYIANSASGYPSYDSGGGGQ